MRAEKLLNAATTTLNGAVDAVTTSFTLTDGSVFPAEGDYRLSLDQEIVLVTHRSTNVITVERGVDGTTAASHDDGADISTLLTQEALDQYIKDFVDPAAFDRGGAHRTPGSAAFMQLNMGTSTVVDDSWGGISIEMQNAANPAARVLYKTAPATPYEIVAHVMGGIYTNGSPDNTPLLGFRESSSGKLSHISYHYGTNAYVQYLNSPTTSGPANSASHNVPKRADYWLKIGYDGTNLKYYISGDGYNWFEMRSELPTHHFNTAPDQVWFGGDNNGNDNEWVHLLAWIEL